MIQINSESANAPKTIKAVGLMSGGLDSTLAARIMKDLGVEVHGVYFAMPWGCCDKGKAQSAAQSLGVPLVILQLDERYLEVVRKPQYGYGVALNPCVDCRIHMFKRAAQYMEHIGADFVFTGEVLGQRNMSQKHRSMKWVEEGSGLKGKLLRPLSAKHLPETFMEKQGLIDRSKLLAITGRGRSPQMTLAKDLNVTEYSLPAGGCKLTDKHFALRMKDTLFYGYRNFRETVALQWGRHFRLSPEFKAIVGRDEEENKALIHYAHPDDLIMQLEDNRGPTVILKGKNPTPNLIDLCGQMLKYFSRYKTAPTARMKYWLQSDRNQIHFIDIASINEDRFLPMHIS